MVHSVYIEFGDMAANTDWLTFSFGGLAKDYLKYFHSIILLKILLAVTLVIEEKIVKSPN